jgi:hypothetical protein
LGKKANVNRISGKTNGNARKKWFKGFSPVEKKIWKGFFAWQFRPFLFIINGKAELPENRGYSLIRINSRATFFLPSVPRTQSMKALITPAGAVWVNKKNGRCTL